MKLGNLDIQNVKLGGSDINKVMLGSLSVWERNGEEQPSPEGGYRYIRMRLLEHGASSINEIEAYAGGQNVALGKTVTSSVNPWVTGSPQGITDGNVTFANTLSWWIGHSNWVIHIDLGRSYPLTHIDVIRTVANNTQITIEVSENNLDWIATNGAGTGANPRFTI